VALRVVANRLTSRPRSTVGDLVDRLSLPDERLSRLAAGDAQLRVVFGERHRDRPALPPLKVGVPRSGVRPGFAATAA
jgi:hypothetical protein